MSYTPDLCRPPANESEWGDNLQRMHNREPYYSFGAITIGAVKTPKQLRCTGPFQELETVDIADCIDEDAAAQNHFKLPDTLTFDGGRYIREPLLALLENRKDRLPQRVWHCDAPELDGTMSILLATINGPKGVAARGVVSRTGPKGHLKLHDVEVDRLEHGTLYFLPDGAAHRGSRRPAFSRIIARSGMNRIAPTFATISGLMNDAARDNQG